MRNVIEEYLTHIESIAGQGGRYFRISDKGECPGIAVVSYEGVPEEGCITAFSYGLSSVPHKEWTQSRPELVISVNSVDQAWPLAMGEIIRNGRQECLFSYGTIVNFGQQISKESQMSAFLVFACSVLEENDLAFSLSDRRIHFSQLYPIYFQEASLIKELGAERFFIRLGQDAFNVKRTPIR